MNDCTTCQISIETAKLGMFICSMVIALLIVFNLGVIRHWWARQIEKVIQRWRGQG